MCALTMKREHNVIGWHRHVTDGKYLAVTSIPGDFEWDLFTVVERTIGGVKKWYIEVKAHQFDSQDARDGRFLDSYLEYNGEEAIGTVTGLEHLEGKEVSILANGRVHPKRTVVDGSITLDKNFNYIVVGLPFTSRLIPTPGVVTMEDGLSHSLLSRVVSSKVALKDSAGFKVGVQDARGNTTLTYVPKVNPAVPDSLPTPLTTSIVDVTLPESPNDPEAARTQRVVVEQDLPLPLTVLGLTDNVYYSEA